MKSSTNKTPSPPSTPKHNNISSKKKQHFQESATSLIQSLEDAFANMTDLTQQAEQDANEARSNAKLAMEIARKYTTRNYISNNEYEELFLQNDANIMNTKPKQEDGGGGGNDNEPITLEQNNIPLSIPQSIENSQFEQQRRHHSPSTSSSQSHEILTLTLELERTKQALQNVTHELRTHQKLVTDLRQSITSKDEEISNLASQVQIAEEDANMAMEVAKQNSDKREEMEGFLHKALSEITNLKTQQQSQQLNELVPIQEMDDEEERNENKDNNANMIIPMQQPNKNTTAIERGRGVLHLYRANNTSIQKKKNITTLSKLHNLMQTNDNKFMFTQHNQQQLTKSPSTSLSYYESNLIFKKLKDSSEKLKILLPKVSKDTLIDNIISSYCSCVERKMLLQMERIQELDSYCYFLEKNCYDSNNSNNTSNAIVEKDE